MPVAIAFAASLSIYKSTSHKHRLSTSKVVLTDSVFGVMQAPRWHQIAHTSSPGHLNKMARVGGAAGSARAVFLFYLLTTSCHLRWWVVADRLGSARGGGSSGMLFPRSAPVLRSVLLYSREAKRGRGGRGRYRRATERAVSMPRSTEGKTPQKTPESSAPRPYMGYVSSRWHTRQPHTP